MPPATRISVRKKHAFCLGYRAVYLKVGLKPTTYQVHGDLLCKSSAYFRSTLQPDRKEIEGDCPICHEKLLPGVEQLTFCQAFCGVNFHSHCIYAWKKQCRGRWTCPHCRTPWKPFKPHWINLPDIDQRSVDIYLEWLYHAKILATPQAEDENCCGELIEAYAVGMRFEDKNFCNAVLHAIVDVIEDDEDYPDVEVVGLAYRKTDGPCSLRKLLLAIYLEWVPLSKPDLDDLWNGVPMEFSQDLFKATMNWMSDRNGKLVLEGLRDHIPLDEEPDVPVENASGTNASNTNA